MNYDTYGLCACGYFEKLPFGDMRRVHKSVCPGCGESVYRWEKVVGRVVGFWNQRLERKPDAA